MSPTLRCSVAALGGKGLQRNRIRSLRKYKQFPHVYTSDQCIITIYGCVTVATAMSISEQATMDLQPQATIVAFNITENVTETALVVSSTIDSLLELKKANEKYSTTLIPCMVYIGVLMFVGLIGNSLVLYVFGFRMKRSAQNYCIIFLALFDLLSCTVGLPTEITDIALHFVFDSAVPCKIMRLVNAFTAMSSICTLIVIAIDRFRRVRKPLKSQITSRHAKLSLIPITATSLIFASPALYVYGLRTVKAGEYGVDGLDCTISDEAKNTMIPLIYNGVLFILFVFLATCLIVMYAMILRGLKEHAKNLRKLSIATTVSSGTESMNETCSTNDDSVSGNHFSDSEEHPRKNSGAVFCSSSGGSGKDVPSDRNNRGILPFSWRHKNVNFNNEHVSEKYKTSTVKEKSTQQEIFSGSQGAVKLEASDSSAENMKNKIIVTERAIDLLDKHSDETGSGERSNVTNNEAALKSHSEPDLVGRKSALEIQDFKCDNAQGNDCINASTRIDHSKDSEKDTSTVSDPATGEVGVGEYSNASYIDLLNENNANRYEVSNVTTTTGSSPHHVTFQVSCISIDANKETTPFVCDPSLSDCCYTISDTPNNNSQRNNASFMNQLFNIQSSIKSKSEISTNHSQKHTKQKTYEKETPKQRSLTKKTTIIAFVVTLVFIISFVPHLCLQVAHLILKGFDEKLEGAPLVLYNTFLRSYFINSVANPIVYGVMNDKFRDEVKLLMLRFRCWKR